jgi:hypothetical protein
MSKQKSTTQTTLTLREKSLLIVFTVIMIGTLPITYIMFLLPLLYLPVAALAILVIVGKIRNTIAVRTIQTVTILAGLSALWLASVLFNWWMS